jgi:hypothetical protein
MPSLIYGKYGALGGSSIYGEGKPTEEAGGAGPPDYGTEQSSINITHTVDGVLFTWTVNGYDAALQTGTFYDGSPWVAPSSSGGAVRLTALTPATYDPIEVGFDNPSNLGVGRNLSATGLGNSSQGLLPTATYLYHQALDIRNQFPIVMIPNAEGVISLIGPQFQHESREAVLNFQCIQCSSVLTILDTPPTGSVSGEYFRPSPYSGDKTIYTSEDFNFATLPSEIDVDSSVNTTAYTAITSWWGQFWPENVSHVSGELGRAFIPDQGPSNGYGADVGNQLHTDILSCFGTDALVTAKKDAVYALLQSGIDLYGGWKSGFTWGPGGAGQRIGKRARISFFGALIINTTIKDEIAGIRSSAASGEIPFQEDGQVHKDASAGNVAVWGDLYEGGSFQDKDQYWDMCLNGNAFDGAIGGPVDLASNARNVGDPYGYIDGPAQEPGTQYMGCCSTSIMRSYVLIMRMWPEFAYVAGNTVLPEYIDRVVDDVGIWTTGDVCAPPDPRDALSGKPYSYYGVTWGDDGAGNCITNAQATTAGHPNSPTTGRHSLLHGNPVSFLRESALMLELWTAHGSTP